jgi:WD40 repeat protein
VLRRRYCLCILCAVLAAIIAALLWSGPPIAVAADANVSFINDVAPILKEHCLTCHNSRKRAGKLDMTTFAGLRAGGTHDDPIVPAKPNESLLIERLHTTGPKRMPPPPNDQPTSPEGALPADKALVIAQWIRSGAALDPELTPETDLHRELRKRWQPPSPPNNYLRPAPITALTFSPDGLRIIAGGHHELTIWNAADGRLLARLRTRSERTYAVAFLTDHLIAVAGGRPGQEGDVRVYNLAAGPSAAENGVTMWNGVNDPNVLVSHLLDTDDCMLCLAVSADRKLLAAGGCDPAIRVWDISDGASPNELLQTVDAHTDWVFGLAFSPDRKRLLTSSRDKTAKVWDLAKRETVQTFSDHQKPVFAVTTNKDAKAGFSVGGDKMLRIWNADGSGKAIKAVGGHTDEILKIAAVPGQPLFVTCSADGSVRLWKDDGTAVRTFGNFGDQVYSLAVSPDGARVAAGSYNGQVRIWRIADGAEVSNWIAAPGHKPKSTVQK